jgi:hypothetical protein
MTSRNEWGDGLRGSDGAVGGAVGGSGGHP